MEGRLCNIYKQPVIDSIETNSAMIIGVVIGVVLLLSKFFVMPSSSEPYNMHLLEWSVKKLTFIVQDCRCFGNLIMFISEMTEIIIIFNNISVLVIIVVFLLMRARNKATDQKNILNYEKEDYDIRENIVDYDEDGAGKGKSFINL